jgi:hypothetical protein
MACAPVFSVSKQGVEERVRSRSYRCRRWHPAYRAGHAAVHRDRQPRILHRRPRTGPGRPVPPRHQRWDATDAEVAAATPGDDLIHQAAYRATGAITIGAPPEEVWPWPVQAGCLQAGFYASDLPCWRRGSSAPSCHSAFRAGALSVSLPVIDTLEPVSAAAIAAVVFGERLAASPGQLAAQLAGGAAAAAGIAALSLPAAGRRYPSRPATSTPSR